MFLQLKHEYLGHKAGTRLEVPDQHAQDLIGKGVAEAIQGNPIKDLVAKEIGDALTNLSKELNEAINQALTQFKAEASKSRKNAIPAIFGEGGDGDPNHNFGDWLYCVATGNHKRLQDHYKSEFIDRKGQKAAMAEGSGVTGGYIVPPDFYRNLTSLVEEQSQIRKRAFIMPMASATLQFPYLDVTTVQAAGSSPFFGGVTMYWTQEAQTRTETEPQFKMMELKAQELSGYAVSSNILLQDAAFGLEKFLMTLFSRAIAWYEQYAFIQGNGVGKPLGMKTASACITSGPNAGARTTANQVKFADVAFMFGKLLPSSVQNAIWLFSPTVAAQILQLADAGNRALFLNTEAVGTGAAGGGIKQKPVWQLLGMPAIETEMLPALGTPGDLMLVDPSLYVIGDRQQVEIAASEHVNFLKNQMTWRVVERIDGKPWLDNPVTLQDGTTQVSGFVALN